MCDPISAIGAAGLAVSVVAAGVSAYGQHQQAEASNAAAAYNAQVANYQAQQAQALGQVQAKQNDLQTQQLESRQKALYAASGVDPNSGSAQTVQNQTAGYGALDSLAIKQNAASQAWGFTNSANLNNAKIVNPYGGAATSLLTSASSIGQTGLQDYRTGVFAGTN